MGNLRFISVAILLFFATNIAFANDYMYNQQMKYYNSMKTCTMGTFPLGGVSLGSGDKTAEIGMNYYIYGMQNSKCHIREHLGNSNKHCYLPREVAKKYAEEGIKTLNAARNGAAYSQYINQISNDENYCKYED